MIYDLYLYDSITDESVLKIVQEISSINEKENDLYSKNYREVVNLCQEGVLDDNTVVQDSSDSRILLHINSGGGYLNSGFSLINTMKYSLVPVDTICDGVAMSMAFIILISGERRYGYTTSMIMHHPLAYGIDGQLNDHIKQLKHAERQKKLITDIVRENTLLEEAEIETNTEIYWYGDNNKLYDLGIIDSFMDKSVSEDMFVGDCEVCDVCTNCEEEL